MINNHEELAAHVGAEDACEGTVARRVYMDTSCGATVTLHDGYVLVGTIVEGSDAEFTNDRLVYPFTEEAWAEAIQACEDFADAHWGEEET